MTGSQGELGNDSYTSEGDLALAECQTAEMGRAASVRSSNSSPESGQWNFAAWERPVVSAYSRPLAAARTCPTATAVSGVLPPHPHFAEHLLPQCARRPRSDPACG